MRGSTPYYFSSTGSEYDEGNNPTPQKLLRNNDTCKFIYKLKLNTMFRIISTGCSKLISKSLFLS